MLFLPGGWIFAQSGFDSLREKGLEEYNQGNTDLALKYYSQLLEACRTAGDAACEANSHRLIGDAYRAGREFEPALVHLREASRLAKPLGDSLLLARILNRFGAVFYEAKEEDSALIYTQKSLELTESLADTDFTANNLNLLGAIARWHSPDQSLLYFFQSLEIQRFRKNQTDVPNVLNNIATTYLQQQNYDEAIRYGLESFELAKKEKVKPYVHWAASVLTKAYLAKGDFEHAFTYQTLVNIYQDSLYNEGRARQMAEMNARYEKERSEREYELLRKDNVLTERQNTILFVTTLLVSLILLGALLGIFQVNRSRKRKMAANEILQAKNGEIEEKNLQIQAQNQRLGELNQIKDRIFSIISHDLRSPLNSLHGILTLIKSGALSESEIRGLTSSLIDRVDHTTMLVDNLLNWSRSQLEGFQVQAGEVNLAELVAGVVQLLKPQAEAKGIVLENRLQGNLPAFADPEMMKLVFRNLISNAIKFTPKGGKIEITGLVDGGEAKVWVRDSGVGMSEQILAKLFGNEHVSSYGTANEQGSGLGLLLVKEFLEKNGGKIQVTSKTGEGSEFVVFLPLVSILQSSD
ncbi:MAG: tetratricopeptide repeat-containing sensor histidine kinase [Bacteroidia bacterium]|nr:tetratricopeptide repeat-containing sensor histidine kinase [Bacteroidia bacterium]